MRCASRSACVAWLAWASCGLLGGFSCRQVIGIEDAELDPGPEQVAGAGAAHDDAGAPLSGGGVASGGAPGASAGDEAGGAAGAVSEAAGAGGEAGSPPQSLCESYCTTVSASCQGPFAVYTSYEACLAVCALLPEGKPGDRNVNTVECRLHAASIASSEATAKAATNWYSL